MARTVFVTGGDRGLGFALCAKLLEQGWQVFAGQYLPIGRSYPPWQTDTLKHCTLFPWMSARWSLPMPPRRPWQR